MWDCTSVLKEKNRSCLVKRTMNKGGDGERLGRDCKDLHPGLISLTLGSNSWSSTSFLSAMMHSTSAQLQGRIPYAMKAQIQHSNFP